MRRVAALALVIIVVGGGVAAVALGPFAQLDRGESGDLEPLWTSDTQRDIQTNHHKIGASADGELILAPVAVPSGHESIATTSDEGDQHTHHEHQHDHDHTGEGASGAETSDTETNIVSGACELVSLDRNGSVDWAYGIPPENCLAHAVTEPAFGDVTGDGRREIVFGTTENAVVVLDQEGEEVRRIRTESYGHSRPTVANVTAAPGPEIVSSDVRANVVVADRDGVVWRDSVEGTAYPAPIVADVAGGDDPEVVIVTSQRIVAFDTTGDRVWEADIGGWTASIAPDASTLYVGGSSTVYAIDGATGDIDWDHPVDGRPTVGAVVEADASAAEKSDDSEQQSDGRSLVYVGRNGGNVLFLDADSGELVGESERLVDSARQTPAPVVGDLTGDGEREMVLVTNDGLVAVLDAETGTVQARYQTDIPIWVPVTLTDLDSDGASEILVRLGDGRVLALSYTE
jgi:hypothetical protein